MPLRLTIRLRLGHWNLEVGIYLEFIRQAGPRRRPCIRSYFYLLPFTFLLLPLIFFDVNRPPSTVNRLPCTESRIAFRTVHFSLAKAQRL